MLGDIREDLLDAYKYVQKQINVDLLEAGAIYTLDGSRTCALGWSAGASNVLWLVSRLGHLPTGRFSLNRAGPRSTSVQFAITPGPAASTTGSDTHLSVDEA